MILNECTLLLRKHQLLLKGLQPIARNVTYTISRLCKDAVIDQRYPSDEQLKSVIRMWELCKNTHEMIGYRVEMVDIYRYTCNSLYTNILHIT